jgi:hypothetical protein
MSELSDAAYSVADQYRSGRWPELEHLEWDYIWAFLLEELKKRCPGYSDKEYGMALDRGFVESR